MWAQKVERESYPSPKNRGNRTGGWPIGAGRHNRVAGTGGRTELLFDGPPADPARFAVPQRRGRPLPYLNPCSIYKRARPAWQNARRAVWGWDGTVQAAYLLNRTVP